LARNKPQLQLALLFALLGASASILPASIPAMALKFTVPTSSLLSAVPVMFAGLFLGVALAPLISNKFQEGMLIRAFSTVLATGLLLMGNGQSIELFLIASLVLGVGFGVLEVLGTSASKSLQSETASRLTKLQAIFAVSAFITPVLFALAATAFSSTTGFYLIFAFAITFALLCRGSDRVQAQKRVFKKTNRIVFAFMLAAVFYVGAETVIAGWSSVLVSELGGLDAQLAAIGASSFWGLLALGRLISVALTPRVLSPRLALPMWLALAGASLLTGWAFWAVVSPLGVLGAFGLATVAAGPCYALIIGLALDAKDSGNSVALTSTLVLAGSVGGFVLPGILQTLPEIESAALIAGCGFVAALIFSLAGNVKTNSVAHSKETV
jgi:fucose permease